MTKLSAERLAEITERSRKTAVALSEGEAVGSDWRWAIADRRDLLIHIAALQAEVDALARDLTPAAKRVLAERARQKTVEGWTPEHDVEHDQGELAKAASCYALHSSGVRDLTLHPGEEDDEPSRLFPRHWPWGSWWKPKNQCRDLERAGALILAELERLDCAAGRQP